MLYFSRYYLKKANINSFKQLKVTAYFEFQFHLLLSVQKKSNSYPLKEQSKHINISLKSLSQISFIFSKKYIFCVDPIQKFPYIFYSLYYLNILLLLISKQLGLWFYLSRFYKNQSKNNYTIETKVTVLIKILKQKQSYDTKFICKVQNTIIDRQIAKSMKNFIIKWFSMSEHPTLLSIFKLQLLVTLKILKPFPRAILNKKKAIANISLFVSQEFFNLKKDFLLTLTYTMIKIEKQIKIKANEFSNFRHIKINPIQLISLKLDLISSKTSLLYQLQTFSRCISNQEFIRSDKLKLIESKRQQNRKFHLMQVLSINMIIKNQAKLNTTDSNTRNASISLTIECYPRFIKWISQM
ncbi:hypothetical protein ABPG72_000683 [Tetrahymena utriculariae]